MCQNFREIAGVSENYSKFNREERNRAAIFYHLLLKKGNINKFLRFIDCEDKIKCEEFGIYFEYAYLRDLWKKLGNNNKKKFELIKSFLNIPMPGCRVNNYEAFNEYFGATPKASKTDIQSPGRWSMTGTADVEGFSSNKKIKEEDFEKVCKFKWAFNIKPDIVIHTSLDSAVCIETKLESGEGSYPQNKNEKKIFNDVKRELNYIKQTEMQKYLMKKLLGIKTSFVLLVKENVKPPPDYIVKTWTDLFAKLDTNDSLPFMKDMMEN